MHEILPASSSRAGELLAAGWVATERSWAAELDLARADLAALAGAVGRLFPLMVRRLSSDDVDAALSLDELTAPDYPRGPSVDHNPLTAETAAPTHERVAHGAFTPGGSLVAMTYADLRGAAAEVDFTATHPDWRGRGVARGLKAAQALDLKDLGITRVRTGGSDRNAAMIAVNTALGYVIDERWVTLVPPT